MLDLTHFKNRKWYRQGGLILPVFDGVAYRAVADILGFGGFVNVYIGEKNYGYFDKDRFEKIAKEHIDKQFIDIKHIGKLYEISRKAWEKLLDGIDKKKSIADITKLNYSFWKVSWIIEAYDPHGAAIVNEYMHLSDDDKAVLFFPTGMSNVQKERFDILNLIVDKGDIKEHQKEYYYIKASWADGSEYTIDDIKKKIEHEGSIDNVKEEIQKIMKNHEEIIKRKKEILNTLDEKQRKIAYFFQKMTDWREERKIAAQKANCYIQKYLLKKEKETGIPLKLLKFLDIDEVENDIDIEVLKERSKLCANILSKDSNGRFYYTGEDAKQIKDFIEREFFKDVKVVKGLTGNKGKIVGKVKVVMEASDFDKFEQGDILVTAMTRPEFVPIMKKARAIVTDEGGITCHAAIVSRELGIPCVLGTNVATGILKDGMKVEVDADNGEVRVVQC